jgi:hypothetical protein
MKFANEFANHFNRALPDKETSVTNHRQNGIALITTLLILLLMSTMMVGLAWLVMGDQKLGGNNSDHQLAFYGAEAGLEQLTASLENAFNANYALNVTAINALMTTPGPPTNIPNVQYLNPDGTSGYLISFTPSAANANLPSSSFSTIPNGQYAGLVGLMTPYTLQVTSRTTYGSEVRLQREVQTLGIPVFQFGMFSQTDLSFFAGPNFNFGGRVHTNGNLWLAEGNGNTLTMADKVTAAGQIITSNLENGWGTNTNYNGVVNITTGSVFADITAQAPAQSVTGTANSFGNVSAYDSTFAPMATGTYNSYVAVGPMGVKILNLAIATPAIGGQPIDLIRRPVAGEDVSNSAKLAERYYSQASLRILLSDYGASGGCADSDISSASANKIPQLSANLATPTPIDLATLAWDTSSAGTNPPYSAAPGWVTPANVGKTVFPLPVSYAQGVAYGAADGYWVKQYYPTITGCIKIDYQTTAGGAWTDVTPAILNLGYTGRNIDPQVNRNGVPQWNNPQTTNGGTTTVGAQPSLTTINANGTQVAASGPTGNGAVATVGCTDPSPNAVIRLARLRDNPSNATTTKATNNFCGNNPSTGTWANGPNLSGTQCWNTVSVANCPSQHGTDYWPNVLFDAREALLRDSTLVDTDLPLAGAMYYVEIDAANLATWFQANSALVNKPTGYSVYFSDRRSEQTDPAPPASVGGANVLTGGFGYDDLVNPASANGCPDAVLNAGEDLEGDYSNVGVDASPVLRTYGNALSPVPAKLWPIGAIAGGTQVEAAATLVPKILRNNSSCTGPGKTWPFAVAFDAQDLREDPAIFFRRALKIVNGSTITLGVCNSVPCGLTIASENPVYLQGDYNNPGLNTTFTGVGVGAAVIGDAFTFLSDNWNDVNSFAFPYLGNIDKRVAVDTTYRLAVAAGKGVPFIQPTVGGPPQDFGTDGGAHNFLRYLEDWSASTPNAILYYQGSIVSMFYNHQGVGTYKCCTDVYRPPGRGYNFDTNFLTPALLPPLTPMLRDVNTVGFSQMILPTQ